MRKWLDKAIPDPATDLPLDREKLLGALGVLLLETMRADGVMSAEDRNIFANALLEHSTPLKPHEEEVLGIAGDTEQETYDAWEYTRRLKSHLERRHRWEVAGRIWKLIYDTEGLERDELYLGQKIGLVLSMTHTEAFEARQRAFNEG